MEFNAEISACFPMAYMPHSSHHLSSNITTVFYEVFTSMQTAVAQWLRCCATNRKVTGSIPDGVTEIFH